MSKINVLFVCLGNICRSPTAEGVFRALVENEGLTDTFHIDSAGTSGWHRGALPDSRSMKEALRHGVDLSTQRSRAVEDRDFNTFDYILAMDYANMNELKKRCPENLQRRLKLFTSFAPGLGIAEVPDPYYDGPQGFEHVFRIAEASAKGLLQAIMREHALV